MNLAVFQILAFCNQLSAYGATCQKAIADRIKVISDGKEASADRIKAIHGHFYPIADHLNPIEDRFYPIADRLKVIADGKEVISVGFK